MDLPRFFALVKTNGAELELDRRTLRTEFSKFGTVTKIYIDPAKTLAKIYLDNIEHLRTACQHLHKKGNWYIEFSKEKFYENRTHHQTSQNNISRSYCDNSAIHRPDPDTTSLQSNMDSEEECEVLENYVNGQGRPVTVLKADNGQLFVDLNDIRASGFAIFRREDYKTTIFTKIDDLREFENFLLNQAVAYQINTRRNFETDEIFNTIEKVKERLWGPQKNEQNVAKGPTAANAPIPFKNVNPTSSNSGQNKSRHIDQSYGSSFSDMQQKKKEDQTTSMQTITANGFKQEIRNTNQKGPEDVTTSTQKLSLRKPNIDNQTLANLHLKPVGSKNVADEEEDWLDGGVMECTPKPEEQNVVVNSSTVPPETPIESKRKDSDNPNVGSELSESSIGRVSLSISSDPSKVRISYVQERENKSTLYFVQPIGNTDIIEDLLLQVNTLAETQIVVSPVQGGVYLFQFEELWYRGKIKRFNKDQSYLVDLIDYGNTENLLSPVKELPEKLKAIPAQSIRITFTNDNPVPNYQIDDAIDIVAKKQYDDGTYLVHIFTGASESLSQSKHKVLETIKPKPDAVEDNAYFTIPPTLGPLKNNERVMILGFYDGKLLLRTKDCAVHCKDLYKLITEIEKQSITNVKEGQLVLCSRNNTEGLHRGVVRKIENSAAHVEYLDYVGTETLSVKSLRNINAKIAATPKAIVESPPYPALININEIIQEFINNLINTKKKLDVIIENGDFDLRIDNNTLLSEKIEALRVKDQPLSNPVSDGEAAVIYDDMPYAKIKQGAGCYFCYSCKDTDNITLISSEPEYEQYLNDLIITTSDNTPYAPEIYCMCLAKFKDQWYRATVIDIDEKDGTFQVLFVDFGNTYLLKTNDLRRLPKKYATIPILGVSAYFVGLPQNDNKLNLRLQELIPDGKFLDVIVKTDLDPDRLLYGIEIPEIYEKLRSEGFI